jgi:hypothetical protein
LYQKGITVTTEEGGVSMMTKDDEYLTYAEAAARYHVAEVTVRKWAKKGLIGRYKRPGVAKVYVCVRDIEAFKHATPQPKEEEES